MHIRVLRSNLHIPMLKRIINKLFFSHCPYCLQTRKDCERIISAICAVNAEEMQKLRVKLKKPVKIIETRYVYTKNRNQMIKLIGKRRFDELLKISEKSLERIKI